MTTSRLRILAVLLPVGFWLVLISFSTLIFGAERALSADIFALMAIGLGAAAFSSWVFSIVDRQEAEVQRRAEQLAALHEAALALTMELDLGLVLQKVADLSRSLVGARYAAVGVLEDNGEYLEQFITSGLPPEVRATMGELPRGHGLLGVLIKEGKPIRIPDIYKEPRAVGFPPKHPPMHSLLGVPIRAKGRVIGDLYLTDKLAPGGGHNDYAVFSLEDQYVAELFATQAAIAIENAQLYRKTQQLAVLQERQRFGMDLHDGIIQSIYAVGLMLEESALLVESSPAEANAIIRQGLQSLNNVIRDIRNYILDLRPQRFQGRDLEEGLVELAREMRANTLLNIENNADDELDLTGVTPERTAELLHIAQEALTNAAKHARATHVAIELSRQNDCLVMRISDNGYGFDISSPEEKGGYGLRNMHERAAALGGELHVESSVGHGTRLEVQVPLAG